MEAVVQILEAETLAPVMYIPAEMRHSRLEVTLRLAGDAAPRPSINKEIMRKFQHAAESGEAKNLLKKKLAEGVQFNFDVAKFIDGTMTEDDWQKLHTMQKQAWQQAAAEKTGKTTHA